MVFQQYVVKPHILYQHAVVLMKHLFPMQRKGEVEKSNAQLMIYHEDDENDTHLLFRRKNVCMKFVMTQTRILSTIFRY